jgi:hypothetical protein
MWCFAEMNIPCHHIHNLKSYDTKPLVMLLNFEEQPTLKAETNTRRMDVDLIFECGVCSRGHVARGYAFGLSQMISHLLNV